jgi:hypothetical protein
LGVIRHAALTEVVEDRLVIDADEVLLRAARTAGLPQRLEVLLGTPCAPDPSGGGFMGRIL